MWTNHKNSSHIFWTLSQAWCCVLTVQCNSVSSLVVNQSSQCPEARRKSWCYGGLVFISYFTFYICVKDIEDSLGQTYRWIWLANILLEQNLFANKEFNCKWWLQFLKNCLLTEISKCPEIFLKIYVVQWKCVFVKQSLLHASKL